MAVVDAVVDRLDVLAVATAAMPPKIKFILIVDVTIGANPGSGVAPVLQK